MGREGDGGGGKKEPNGAEIHYLPLATKGHDGNPGGESLVDVKEMKEYLDGIYRRNRKLIIGAVVKNLPYFDATKTELQKAINEFSDKFEYEKLGKDIEHNNIEQYARQFIFDAIKSDVVDPTESDISKDEYLCLAALAIIEGVDIILVKIKKEVEPEIESSKISSRIRKDRLRYILQQEKLFKKNFPGDFDFHSKYRHLIGKIAQGPMGVEELIRFINNATDEEINDDPVKFSTAVKVLKEIETQNST